MRSVRFVLDGIREELEARLNLLLLGGSGLCRTLRHREWSNRDGMRERENSISVFQLLLLLLRRCQNVYKRRLTILLRLHRVLRRRNRQGRAMEMIRLGEGVHLPDVVPLLLQLRHHDLREDRQILWHHLRLYHRLHHLGHFAVSLLRLPRMAQHEADLVLRVKAHRHFDHEPCRTNNHNRVHLQPIDPTIPQIKTTPLPQPTQRLAIPAQ